MLLCTEIVDDRSEVGEIEVELCKNVCTLRGRASLCRVCSLRFGFLTSRMIYVRARTEGKIIVEWSESECERERVPTTCKHAPVMGFHHVFS